MSNLSKTKTAEDFYKKELLLTIFEGSNVYFTWTNFMRQFTIWSEKSRNDVNDETILVEHKNITERKRHACQYLGGYVTSKLLAFYKLCR